MIDQQLAVRVVPGQHAVDATLQFCGVLGHFAVEGGVCKSVPAYMLQVKPAAARERRHDFLGNRGTRHGWLSLTRWRQSTETDNHTVSRSDKPPRAADVEIESRAARRDGEAVLAAQPPRRTDDAGFVLETPVVDRVGESSGLGRPGRPTPPALPARLSSSQAVKGEAYRLPSSQ